MNREQLKKIDRFLTFGDIKPKVDETDCYYITDQAMQKVIDGLIEEKLQLERQIIADRLIEIKNRAGQVEPEVKHDFAGIDETKITRLVVVNKEIGRVIDLWNTTVKIDIQNEGRTLKIFYGYKQNSV